MLSDGRLIAALAGILVLALVVPAVGATMLSRARIARAVAEVGNVADQLRRSPAITQAEVLASAGESPRVPAGDGWAGNQTSPLSDYAASAGPDPWGNRYLVNVGTASAAGRLLRQSGEPAQRKDPGRALPVPHAVWVLSAGPNGIIETPFEQPVSTARLFGDDVGARVW